MLRANDGEFVVFIIQYKYTLDSDWANSGDCGQWIVTYDDDSGAYNFIDPDNIETQKEILKPFSACGECWQATGIHGSFKMEEGLLILGLIYTLNPDREFRLVKVELRQKSKPIAIMGNLQCSDNSDPT